MALFFLVLILAAAPAAQAARPPSSSMLMMEARSGRVLAHQNENERRLIASTTKIMTCLVALELCSPDDVAVVPPEAANVEGSSLYLKAGDRLSCRELLNGLMLASGNDAAVVLAVHCSGTVEKFVRRMNRKAAELGMKNTNFANPHGLNDSEHYSTAYDMALLTAFAMQDERFAAIVSQRTARVGGADIRNHNRLLWMVEGCNGVKTGFTKDAGRCLVSSCERDGKLLVVVTLNTPDDWRLHSSLLEAGFAKYTDMVSWNRGEQVAELPVFAGREGFVPVVYGGELHLALTAEEAKRLDVGVTLPRYLWAPVRGGGEIGRLTARLDGKTLGSVPIVTARAVEEVEVSGSFWKKLLGW